MRAREISWATELRFISITAAISSYTWLYSPARKAPRLITMSISSAPLATASRVSARRTGSEA